MIKLELPSYKENRFKNVWYRENGDVLEYAQPSCAHCIRKPPLRILRPVDGIISVKNAAGILVELPVEFIEDLLTSTEPVKVVVEKEVETIQSSIFSDDYEDDES